MTEEKRFPMNTKSPARAGRREWIGLARLILPRLVISMAVTVQRVDRACHAHAAHPAHLYGCDRAASGSATPERWSPAQRCATAMDHRYLRFHDRRVANHY